MKKYKTMIFDLDGTLLDSKKDIVVATDATIRHVGGTPLSEAVIASFVGHGVRDLIRNAIQGDVAKEAEATRFFREYYLGHCTDHSRFFPGAVEALEELARRGVRFAVHTNKPQVYTDRILDALGVTRFFEAVIGAEAGFPNKPARTGSDALLVRLRAAPSETLMVGDSVVDLETAEAVGMDCALSLNGFATREEILALEERATHIYEVPSFWLELG